MPVTSEGRVDMQRAVDQAQETVREIEFQAQKEAADASRMEQELAEAEALRQQREEAQEEGSLLQEKIQETMG